MNPLAILIIVWFGFGLLGVITYFIGMVMCDKKLYINDEAIFQCASIYIRGIWGCFVSVGAVLAFLKSEKNKEKK